MFGLWDSPVSRLLQQQLALAPQQLRDVGAFSTAIGLRQCLVNDIKRLGEPPQAGGALSERAEEAWGSDAPADLLGPLRAC